MDKNTRTGIVFHHTIDEDRAGMGEFDILPFGRQLFLQYFRLREYIERRHCCQRLRGNGIILRDLECEIEVFGLVGFVEQRIGNEGADAVVDETCHRLECFVVQPFGLQRPFQGAEEVVAIGQQVGLEAFQCDKRIRFRVEKGIRKTTQCVLDGHSVLR